MSSRATGSASTVISSNRWISTSSRRRSSNWASTGCCSITNQRPERTALEVAMSDVLHVLVLEDNLEDAELMVYELEQTGFEVDWRRVESEADYAAHLEQGIDIILADYNLPMFNAPRALQCLRANRLDIPFIVVTGTASEEAVVECMKQGAADYLIKDRMMRLGPAVAH